MWDKLEQIERRYQELSEQIAIPEVIADLGRLQILAQERASIESLVTGYRKHKAVAQSLMETQAMLNDGLDEGMATMVKQEIESLESQLARLFQELKLALLPKDASDERDIIVEIRAGAGGDEAGLFAADLFRMYGRYAQSKGWGADIINVHESGIGGSRRLYLK